MCDSEAAQSASLSGAEGQERLAIDAQRQLHDAIVNASAGHARRRLSGRECWSHDFETTVSGITARRYSLANEMDGRRSGRTPLFRVKGALFAALSDWL